MWEEMFCCYSALFNVKSVSSFHNDNVEYIYTENVPTVTADIC